MRFIKTLLFVCVVGFMATPPVSAALNEGRFTATGTFHAVELRSDSLFPSGFEAWIWILVKEGGEVYDVAVKCPNVASCWPTAIDWFDCTSISTATTTDPHDSGVTITRKNCSAFAINQCVKASGTLQNHPDPATHYGSALVAETLGNVKPHNCDPVD